MKDRQDRHLKVIQRQFSRQAKAFSSSPSLHDGARLSGLIEAAEPQPDDALLDVACGPGSVVAAFAPHVRSATGIDVTGAMLDQARSIERERGLLNVRWDKGSAYALPYPAACFDIVICRFAFHHFEDPPAAFAEMLRVSKPGARLILCDAIAPDDPDKAFALNEMERLRDPSTVSFRTLGYLLKLFEASDCGAPAVQHAVHHTSMSALLRNSFPAAGDFERLRQLLVQAVEGDRLGLNARWQGEDVLFEAPIVTLSARRPSP